jgi:site-specific DNA recombinase
MSTRAAIYCRISRDRTGEAAGVRRQEAECRALAEHRGWDVAAVFVDDDVSAFSGKFRPEYRRLLADIRDGKVDAVIAWHPDRLYRRMVDLEELIAIIERTDVQVATVSAGNVDLGTPAGRASARIIGTMARYESEQKGERHRSQHRELAQAGRWHGGGRRRFGYRAVDADGQEGGTKKPFRLVLDKDEAKLLRKAASDVINGASLYSVQKRWNESGVRTTGGRRWTMTDVRRTLLSPSVAGKRVHAPTGTIRDAAWPAILSPATHELLLARLNDPARRTGVQTGQRHGRRYILTGLARCGRCGQPLVGRKRKGKAWAYFCSSGAGGCGQLAVVGWQVDDLVMGRVYDRLREAPPDVPPDESPEREDLLRQLGELEARVAAIDTDYANGTITGTELRAAKATVDERRRALERRVGELISSSPAPGLDWDELMKSGQDWHDRLVAGDLTPAEAAESRDWVAAWVDEIIVHPAEKRGARFDKSRVTVTWRR